MLLRLFQLLNPEVVWGKSPTPNLSFHGEQEEITDMNPTQQDMAPQGTIPCSELQGHPGALWGLTGFSPFQATLKWFPLFLLPKQQIWDVQKSAGIPPCHWRFLTFSRVCTNWSTGMEPLSSGFKDLHSGTSSLTRFLFLLAGGWGGFGGSWWMRR